MGKTCALPMKLF